MENVTFNLSSVHGEVDILQKLKIDNHLYDLHDPCVDELASQVQTAINNVIDQVNTNSSSIENIIEQEEVVAASLNDLHQNKQDVISDYTDNGSGPVTAVNQTDGQISVTHGNIDSSNVNSSSSNYSNIETVEDHLTALENAISSITGVSPELLAELEKIIAEIEGDDTSSAANAWITLIDKLKGLTVTENGQSVEKTVAQYVNIKDAELEQSIKDQIDAKLSSVTLNDKYYTTSYNASTGTLEMTLHTDTTTINTIAPFASPAPVQP